jgi:NAD(P)-dependent dehydrogenase (short-subunit alcohol dehydrogenase family)
MKDLKNKRIVVTGGNSGIGLAAARRCAEEGASVAIVARRQAALDEAVASIGHGARAYACDVTSVQGLSQLFKRIEADMGGLEGLVISAGGTGAGPLPTCTEEAFDDLISLNIKSVFFTTQKALPLLANPSAIVIIGSIASEIVVPGGSVYAATKAALKQFARCWAEDLGPRGIRVSVLAPGYTETPLLERLSSTSEGQKIFDHMVNDRTSLKRRGRADEVGAVAAFLCSDDASYMTGGTIFVGGGGENW